MIAHTMETVDKARHDLSDLAAVLDLDHQARRIAEQYAQTLQVAH